MRTVLLSLCILFGVLCVESKARHWGFPYPPRPYSVRSNRVYYARPTVYPARYVPFNTLISGRVITFQPYVRRTR